MWSVPLIQAGQKKEKTGMRMQFVAAMLALPLLVAAGCKGEEDKVSSVSKLPKKERDVIVESLVGPPTTYGTTNVPFYSKVTFKAKKLGTEKDIVCLQVIMGASISLACPGMQTTPLPAPLLEEPKP